MAEEGKWPSQNYSSGWSTARAPDTEATLKQLRLLDLKLASTPPSIRPRSRGHALFLTRRKLHTALSCSSSFPRHKRTWAEHGSAAS